MGHGRRRAVAATSGVSDPAFVESTSVSTVAPHPFGPKRNTTTANVDVATKGSWHFELQVPVSPVG